MEQFCPFISIIIPTFNRPERLAVCLRACLRLDYPSDRFEVIVVDDGGTLPLDKVIEPHHGKIRIKLLRQNNAGPAMARNAGALVAEGEFLAFTDDDCEPAPDWLKVLSLEFGASPDCAIGGQTANALTRNLYSTATQLLVSYIIGYYAEGPKRVRFFPSSNLGFPAARFRDLGGFNGSFPRSAGEDREVCDRWQREGLRMIHAPEAIVYHSHHLTGKTFLRQHFVYGTGAYFYHALRTRRQRPPLKFEPLSFYVNILTFPFGKIAFWKTLGIIPLLVVAQAVNAMGFFWEYRKAIKIRTGSAGAPV